MRKVLVGLVLLVGVMCITLSFAFAQGVETQYYKAGSTAVGMFTNTVGMSVTGLSIEFDREVTIVNKVEFGGYLPALGVSTGTSFYYGGGEVVAMGTVQLDWEPVEAQPTFIVWLIGDKPAGVPYFTTLDRLGWLLGQGIVHVREQNPELLTAAFAQFFAANAEFFGALEETLGMSLEESLMPIIMAAPAEAIENFFNTIVGMLGVTTLGDILQGDVDFSSLFELLGL